MKRVFICLTIAMLSTLSAGSPPFFPKMVVTGATVLHKAADLVTFNVTVLAQAETAKDALSLNNERMNDLVEKLKEAGLEKGEYSTGQFSIQPVYTPYPRNPPTEWKPSIIAYDVNNTLFIKTTKLDLAPSIIDAAGRAGVDQLSNIVFTINDPLIYRSEAISQATANAMQDAESLARAANLKLVRILDIVLDQPQAQPRPGFNLYAMAKAESAPFIEAPDVDVRANVTITFEIASK